MISGTSTHKKITVFVVFFFHASYYKAKWAFFCSENVIKLPVLIQTPFNIFIVHMNILRVCKPTTHWWMYWEANVRLSNKNTPFFQKKKIYRKEDLKFKIFPPLRSSKLFTKNWIWDHFSDQIVIWDHYWSDRRSLLGPNFKS